VKGVDDIAREDLLRVGRRVAELEKHLQRVDGVEAGLRKLRDQICDLVDLDEDDGYNVDPEGHEQHDDEKPSNSGGDGGGVRNTNSNGIYDSNRRSRGSVVRDHSIAGRQRMTPVGSHGDPNMQTTGSLNGHGEDEEEESARPRSGRHLGRQKTLSAGGKTGRRLQEVEERLQNLEDRTLWWEANGRPKSQEHQLQILAAQRAAEEARILAEASEGTFKNLTGTMKTTGSHGLTGKRILTQTGELGELLEGEDIEESLQLASGEVMSKTRSAARLHATLHGQALPRYDSKASGGPTGHAGPVIEAAALAEASLTATEGHRRRCEELCRLAEGAAEAASSSVSVVENLRKQLEGLVHGIGPTNNGGNQDLLRLDGGALFPSFNNSSSSNNNNNSNEYDSNCYSSGGGGAGSGPDGAAGGNGQGGDDPTAANAAAIARDKEIAEYMEKQQMVESRVRQLEESLEETLAQEQLPEAIGRSLRSICEDVGFCLQRCQLFGQLPEMQAAIKRFERSLAINAILHAKWQSPLSPKEEKSISSEHTSLASPSPGFHPAPVPGRLSQPNLIASQSAPDLHSNGAGRDKATTAASFFPSQNKASKSSNKKGVRSVSDWVRPHTPLQIEPLLFSQHTNAQGGLEFSPKTRQKAPNLLISGESIADKAHVVLPEIAGPSGAASSQAIPPSPTHERPPNVPSLPQIAHLKRM